MQATCSLVVMALIGYGNFQEKVRLIIHFPSTHLYTWVERGTVRVKRLSQEHNAWQPGLKPGPLDLEKSAQTMRPQVSTEY